MVLHKGMIRVQFHAFDKDSSANFSETAGGDTFVEIQEQWEAFKQRVPFPRWYPENELVEGPDELQEQLDDLD